MRVRGIQRPFLISLLALSGCHGGAGGEVGKESVTTGATYTLVRSGSGKCLDIAAAGTSDGTNIRQWSCNATGAQQFRVDDLGGGKVQLVNPASNKCVDVASAGTSDGTNIQLWDCNGTGAQSYTVEDMGGGYFRLRNSNSNKCVDVAAASSSDGANVQLYTCNGTAAQSWQFDLVSGGGNGGSGGSGGGGNGGSGGGGGGMMPADGGAPDAAMPAPCAPSWNVTATCGGGSGGAAPDFGPNVIVLDPSMSMQTIQSQLDGLYQQQDAAQFGTGRYAYLFKPGKYNLDVKVGFYTQALGLGQSPDDVSISGAVRAKADWLGSNNATCNFWRGVENLSVTPANNIDSNVDIWAVSQGTQLRRLHVAGDLALDDNGWSSGGFIADTLIDGQIRSGTQQQFLTRNDDQNWTGSNWNMVFVGDGTAPAGTWPNPPYTVAATTPIVREKPFLYLDSAGNYLVMVPGLKNNSKGHSWANGAAPGLPLSIDRFYIAKPNTDNAASLNAALAAGKHLLFTPGIYHLESSIQVSSANSILLGLGLATLITDKGTPLISVADVDGVTLAGLLLEAGPTSSPTLLQLGPAGSALDHAANPTFVFDVHCRVGGADAGTAQSCVTVDSNSVVIDNMWLWRADHGAGASWDGNRSANGLIVNGNDVTVYGLFVEHFQEYQTLWNGNGGAVYFYQSEMPYDPPNQAAWMAAPNHNGYPSYKVADGVTSHRAFGLGVYSVFTNNVTADNAMESPVSAGVQLIHTMSVSLASGSITHILNGTGGSVGNGTMTAFSPN